MRRRRRRGAPPPPAPARPAARIGRLGDSHNAFRRCKLHEKRAAARWRGLHAGKILRRPLRRPHRSAEAGAALQRSRPAHLKEANFQLHVWLPPVHGHVRIREPDAAVSPAHLHLPEVELPTGRAALICIQVRPQPRGRRRSVQHFHSLQHRIPLSILFYDRHNHHLHIMQGSWPACGAHQDKP